MSLRCFVPRVGHTRGPLDPLFCLSDHCCLSYTVFLKCFRSLLQRFGYNPKNYGGHSFRRGAATWAGSVGLSDYDIKMLGYWSSDCFFYDILILVKTCALKPWHISVLYTTTILTTYPPSWLGLGLFLLCHCKRGFLDLGLTSWLISMFPFHWICKFPCLVILKKVCSLISMFPFHWIYVHFFVKICYITCDYLAVSIILKVLLGLFKKPTLPIPLFMFIYVVYKLWFCTCYNMYKIIVHVIT